MILTVAAFLSALGIGTWLIGSLLDRPGIAVIGGVLVFGVGFMVTAGGLQFHSGATKVTNSTTNTTTVAYQYQSVSFPQRLPAGVLVMLLGGLFVLHGLNIGDEGIR